MGLPFERSAACRAERRIIQGAHGDGTTTRAPAPAQAAAGAVETAPARPGEGAPAPAREGLSGYAAEAPAMVLPDHAGQHDAELVATARLGDERQGAPRRCRCRGRGPRLQRPALRLPVARGK